MNLKGTSGDAEDSSAVESRMKLSASEQVGGEDAVSLSYSFTQRLNHASARDPQIKEEEKAEKEQGKGETK